jgi:small subunit ribosomal protein S3Ae
VSFAVFFISSSRSIPNTIGTRIQKECQGIYPLKDVYIRKVKLLKAPKFDLYKLMEWHDSSNVSAGKKVNLKEQEPEQDTGAKVE